MVIGATVGTVAPVSSRLHIAMADDEPADQALMQMAADEAALTADFAFYQSGEALLADLEPLEQSTDLPHVIILDLRMPGLDGYQTLDRLQGDPVLWAIPVILLTSSTRSAEKTLSLRRGATLFQQKPEDFSKLVSLARALPVLASGASEIPNADRELDHPPNPRPEDSDPRQATLRDWLSATTTRRASEPASRPSDEDRIAELERRVAELEKSSRPLRFVSAAGSDDGSVDCAL